MGNERSVLLERETLHPETKREQFSHTTLPPISFPDRAIPSPFSFGDRTIFASAKNNTPDLHHQSLTDFEAGNEQMEVIRKVGFQAYIDDQRRSDKNVDQRVHDAFPAHPTCVCCMDERVVSQESSGVFIAGSGILIKDHFLSRTIFIRNCRRRGVKDVRLHKKCGAVGIYAQTKGISIEQAEKEAEEWAHYLAKKLGGRVIEPPYEVRPEYHVARAVYYDMTGQFNPSHAQGVFPPGFVISRSHTDGFHGYNQVGKAIRIAFDHGYHQNFTEKHPLYLVLVVKNQKQLQAFYFELKRIIDYWTNSSEQRKIKLDFFIMGDLEPEKPKNSSDVGSSSSGKGGAGNPELTGTSKAGKGNGNQTDTNSTSNAPFAGKKEPISSVPNNPQRRSESTPSGGRARRDSIFNRRGGFGFISRARESIGNMFRSTGENFGTVAMIPIHAFSNLVTYVKSYLPSSNDGHFSRRGSSGDHDTEVWAGGIAIGTITYAIVAGVSLFFGATSLLPATIVGITLGLLTAFANYHHNNHAYA